MLLTLEKCHLNETGWMECQQIGLELIKFLCLIKFTGTTLFCRLYKKQKKWEKGGEILTEIFCRSSASKASSLVGVQNSGLLCCRPTHDLRTPGWGCADPISRDDACHACLQSTRVSHAVDHQKMHTTHHSNAERSISESIHPSREREAFESRLVQLQH
jgi:hypothetical protein